MAVPEKADISEEQQEIAKLVRSGAYFDDARHWYQALYIGPISERTLFVIIATLASLVGAAGVISVLLLLPIVPRPPLLVANTPLGKSSLGLQRMRTQYRPLNASVQEFFVKQYVFMRESYDAVHYPKDYAFIHAHSDAPTFAVYAQGFDTANAQSPLVTLGERGQRFTTIRGIEVDSSVEPNVAKVKFSTETVIGDAATITQWTATLGFYYSDLAVTTVTDPTTGELRTQTQEPVFQVVNYALTPATVVP
jgi:type IV secretory pathway component VirB8